jgi:chromosome partitioning protein
LTGCLGLDLLPSSPALAGAEVEMVEFAGRELRLKQALEGLRARYDFLLIDTPPSLGLLTVNSLTAANGVLIPIQCEYLPLEGLAQLLRTIDLVRQGLNPGLAIRGLIMTMYDPRTNLSRQVVDQVRQHFPGYLFRTIIPRSVKLSQSQGMPPIQVVARPMRPCARRSWRLKCRNNNTVVERNSARGGDRAWHPNQGVAWARAWERSSPRWG